MRTIQANNQLGRMFQIAFTVAVLCTLSMAKNIDVELETPVCFEGKLFTTNAIQANIRLQDLKQKLSQLFGQVKFKQPERGYQFVYDFADEAYSLENYGISLKLKAAALDTVNYRVKSTIKISSIDKALYQYLLQLEALDVNTNSVAEFNLDENVLEMMNQQGFTQLFDPIESQSFKNASEKLSHEVSFEAGLEIHDSDFSQSNIKNLYLFKSGGRTIQHFKNETNSPYGNIQRKMLNAIALLRDIPMQAMHDPGSKVSEKLKNGLNIKHLGGLTYKKYVWSLGAKETDWRNTNENNRSIFENFMQKHKFEVHLEQWTNENDFKSPHSTFEISLKAINIKQEEAIQNLGQYFYTALDDAGIQRCESRLKNRDFARGRLETPVLGKALDLKMTK